VASRRRRCPARRTGDRSRAVRKPMASRIITTDSRDRALPKTVHKVDRGRRVSTTITTSLVSLVDKDLPRMGRREERGITTTDLAEDLAARASRIMDRRVARKCRVSTTVTGLAEHLAAGSSPIVVRTVDSRAGTITMDLVEALAASASRITDMKAVDNGAGIITMDLVEALAASASRIVDMRAADNRVGIITMDLVEALAANASRIVDMRVVDNRVGIITMDLVEALAANALRIMDMRAADSGAGTITMDLVEDLAASSSRIVDMRVVDSGAGIITMDLVEALVVNASRTMDRAVDRGCRANTIIRLARAADRNLGTVGRSPDRGATAAIRTVRGRRMAAMDSVSSSEGRNLARNRSVPARAVLTADRWSINVPCPAARNPATSLPAETARSIIRPDRRQPPVRSSPAPATRSRSPQHCRAARSPSHPTQSAMAPRWRSSRT